MLSPKLLMYAELLPNIRQISVIVALEEPCDLATTAELSADGRRFILHHDGETSSLSLPGRVPPTSLLQKPALGSQELTWRLPLAGQPTRASLENAHSNYAPWSAKWLGEDTEFSCRDCGAVIVHRGSINIWRDLPSENWAEMMDFWHCHKPDVPAANGLNGRDGEVGVEKSIVNRGYGANIKFAPTTGTGFVDLATFLLVDSDCTNIQAEASQEHTSRHQAVACKVCHHCVGYIDHQAVGSRLYKWRLQSTPTSELLSKNTTSNSLNSPSLPTIIGAQLAASMQSQGLSRFVLLPAQWMPTLKVPMYQSHDLSPSRNCSLHVAPTSSSTFFSASMNSDGMCSMADGTLGRGQLPGSSRSTFLSLWILTPSLRFSRNAVQTNSESSFSTPSSAILTNIDYGTLAMKVFWKTVTAEAAEALVDSNGVEEVLLPTDAICEIEAYLRLSSLLLPPSARKFQNWDVGLLERYEE